MTKPAKLPTIHNGHLHWADRPPIQVDSEAWFDALTELRSFVFEDEGHHLTIRREKRKNKLYWYGYRRMNGILKKVYLGRSETLRLAKIGAAAVKLAASQNEQQKQLPPSLDQHASTDLLLHTKLRIPAVPERMVSRHRLTSRLQRVEAGPAPRHHQRSLQPRLTFLVAPAGYGKSTLLSEWVQTIPNEHVAWVGLEAENCDLYQFWRYVVAAFQLAAGGGFGRKTEALLNNPDLPPIRTVLKTILNDIQICPHKLVLILDDYHFVDLDDVHQSMAYFLAHFPARLHVVISSRTAPPLPLGRLRTRCHVTELERDAFQLTEVEVAELFLQSGQKQQEVVTQLHKKTDGWVTGVHLALLAMARDPNDTLRVLDRGHAYFTEYFFETVWQGQSAEMRQFLLCTSLLETFSISLSAEIVGISDTQAHDFLSQLKEANLFLVVLDADKGWYRYHHLFAQALRQLLHRIAPERVPTLHQKIATWHLNHDEWRTGLHHLVQAESWPDVAAQLQHHGVKLIQQGNLAQLLRWTERLPDDILLQNLHLMSIYARGLMLTGDMLAVDTWLTYLEQSAAVHSPAYHEVRQIRAIVHGIEQNRSGSEEAWWDSLTAFTMGVNHWSNGQYDGAIAEFDRAIQLGRSVGNDAIMLLAAGNIATIYILDGALTKGVTFARQMLSEFGVTDQHLLDESFRPNPGFAPLLIVLGYALYERNDLNTSLKYYQRAKQLCEQIGRPDLLVGVHLLLNRVWNALGYPEISQQKLAVAIKLTQEAKLSLWTLSDLYAFRAWLCQHQGDIATATEWIAQIDPTPTDAIVRENVTIYSVCAEIWLKFGNHEQTIRICNQLLAISDRGMRTEPIYKLRLVYAIALFNNGDLQCATEQFSRVLAFTDKEGYLRHYILWYEESCQLLDHVIDHAELPPWQLRYARRLRKRLDAQILSQKMNEAEFEQAMGKLNSLTGRERDVLYLIEKGLTNQQIATQLVLSINTIKSHVSNIFRKLGVQNRGSSVNLYRNLTKLPADAPSG